MKTILIFLISFWFVGCTTFTQYQTMPDITLSRIDLDENVMRPYKVQGQDADTCKLKLKPQPKVPLTDKVNHGKVVISDEDWQRLRPLLNSYCAKKKKDK